MASKKNQEALNYLYENRKDNSYLFVEFKTRLQIAINDLEVYKLAFHKSIEAYNRVGTPPKKILKKQTKEDEDFWLNIARKELNNGK